MPISKEKTDYRLASSLKSLMQSHPFSDITINMIVEKANVIRPTFYNHFKDKYDLLNYVFKHEILDKVQPVLMEGMNREAISLLFHLIRQDFSFYKHAFNVTGQNSFLSMITSDFMKLILDIYDKYGVKSSLINGLDAISTTPYVGNFEGNMIETTLDRFLLANYYANALANFINMWITSGLDILSVEQMETIYYNLLTTSLIETFHIN